MTISRAMYTMAFMAAPWEIDCYDRYESYDRSMTVTTVTSETLCAKDPLCQPREAVSPQTL